MHRAGFKVEGFVVTRFRASVEGITPHRIRRVRLLGSPAFSELFDDRMRSDAFAFYSF